MGFGLVFFCPSHLNDSNIHQHGEGTQAFQKKPSLTSYNWYFAADSPLGSSTGSKCSFTKEVEDIGPLAGNKSKSSTRIPLPVTIGTITKFDQGETSSHTVE